MADLTWTPFYDDVLVTPSGKPRLNGHTSNEGHIIQQERDGSGRIGGYTLVFPKDSEHHSGRHVLCDKLRGAKFFATYPTMID